YGFCDGIPFYLNMVKVPFEKWINKELNKKSSLIKDEVEFLLKYEFSNPGTYKSILEAISLGKNKLGDIKNHIKVQRTDISQYIKNLIDIGIIKREIPVYSTNNSRSGRYYITDFFVKFWFYYVYQNINQIELGNFKLENYNMYLGNVFEEISKQYVAKVYNYPILGKWWYKENEIDIVTGNKEEAIFCEVKWKNEKTGIKILKKLKQKASLLPIKKKKYMIISKSGFTKELEKEDVELVDIKKIKKVFGVC
ncbi:MAG: ATP-binding protein, partial [Nanoarchaeota archaeon]